MAKTLIYIGIFFIIAGVAWMGLDQLGLSRFLGHLPGDIRYKLMMSYSLNYGTHSVHFINKNGEYTTKPQFSWGLELIAPDTKLPFHTALNVGFDKGDLLKNSFGIMLKIFKTGFF